MITTIDPSASTSTRRVHEPSEFLRVDYFLQCLNNSTFRRRFYPPFQTEAARPVSQLETECPPTDADQAVAALAITGIFLPIPTFSSLISSMPSLSVAFTLSGSIWDGRSNTRKIWFERRSE